MSFLNGIHILVEYHVVIMRYSLLQTCTKYWVTVQWQRWCV